MKDNAIKGIKVTIGIGILIALFYQTNQIWDVLRNTTIIAIFFVVGHTFFQILFSGWNVQILAKALKYKFSLQELFLAYSTAWSIGKFFPGGVGELSIGYYLQRKGTSTGDALFISIFDKTLTVCALAILSWVGIWSFLPWRIALWINLLLLVLIGAMSSIFISSQLREVIKRYILRKYSHKFTGFGANFKVFLKEHKKIIILNIILTLIKSFTAAVFIALVLREYGAEVNVFSVLIINAVTVIVSMVPITVAGLGTKEATAVFLYSTLNINAAIVLSTYVLLRVVTMLAAAVIVILNPLPKKKEESLLKDKEGEGTGGVHED